MKNHSPSPKIIGSFTLTMITITAIINLRNLPIMASAGTSAITFYLLAAITYLLPSAYICSRLSSHYPEEGGMYLWVSRAFGAASGFFGMWFEWINNVISFPATLSFIVTAAFYLLMPDIRSNPSLLLLCILGVLWLATLFNFLNIKISSRLNIAGGFIGIIFPIGLLIVLSVHWQLNANPSLLNFSLSHFLPSPHLSEFVLFITALSSYSGMQITAFHAKNVKSPQRDFPRALSLSIVIILLTTLLGSLAIASVIPSHQLNLVSGLMDCFTIYFQQLNLSWGLGIIILCIILGTLAELNAWLIGPALGLACAAKSSYFPSYFAKVNKQGSPTRVLVLQGIIASLFACVFIINENINTAFWLLIVQTSQFTFLMNILMFAAAIRLHYYQADNSPFAALQAKSRYAIWLIAGTPIVTCALAFMMGFIPPESLHIQHVMRYELLLLLTNSIYLAIPFLFYWRTQKS